MTYAQWYRSGNEVSLFGISLCVACHTPKNFSSLALWQTKSSSWLLPGFRDLCMWQLHAWSLWRKDTSEVGDTLSRVLNLSRQTNDCRTQDYTHEKVNKVGSPVCSPQCKILQFWFPFVLQVVVAVGEEGTNDEVCTKGMFSLCLFYYYY